MKKIFVYPLLLFLLLLAACTKKKGSQWQGEIITEGGVTVVRNPEEPIYPEGYLQLVEELAIGQPSGPEEYLLSEIRSVVVDDEGRIYILDSKEDVVKVYDAQGQYLQTIGRPGQGPGELNTPMMISLYGDNLMVVESSRRISFFRLSGEYIRSLSTGEYWVLQAWCDSQGNILAVAPRLDPENPAYEYLKFDPEFKLLFKLTESPAPNAAKGFNPFMAISFALVGVNDQIVFGYPGDYTLQIYSQEGKLLRKISREYTPVAVTEEEIKRWKEESPPDVKLALGKYHSAYRRFRQDEERRLYVQTWEKNAEGYFYHDVFDPEGRYLTRFPLKGEMMAVKQGKIYCREEDEEGYQSLKVYRLVWGSK